MASLVVSLLRSLRFVVRSRAALHLEIIALRHQLAVINRSLPRPRLMSADRVFWVWLSHAWRGWRPALQIIKPETVIGWHGAAFVCSGLGRAATAPGAQACHQTFGP